MSHASLRAGPRKQRGAVAVIAAVATVAMLTCVMLVIEIGRMYSAHRELRKLASLSALDAARVVGGCDSTSAAAPEDVIEGVNATLLQQGLSLEEVAALAPGVLLGQQTSDAGLRVLDTEADADVADSVAVTLTRAFPTPLIPIFTPPAGPMSATAYARQGVVGRVVVGTTLLTLNSEDSVLLNALLGGLLGTTVNLSVADYNGLLSADVTLLELVEANVGVAQVDDLLSLETSLPGALNLISQALYATGEGVELVVAGLLSTLAGIADPNVDEIRLGDYLHVEEGVENLVGALPINVLDLLLGLAQLANEGYAVDFQIPGLLDLSIPGVADVLVQAHLKIGQAPQEALGRPGYRADGSARTVARSSQLMVVLEVGVALLPIGSFSLLSLDLDLAVDAAPATAELAEIHCPTSAEPQSVAFINAETTVARIGIGDFDIGDADPIGNADDLVILELLGLDLLVVDPPIILPLGHNEEGELSYDGPFVPKIEAPAPEHTQTIGVDPSTILSDAVGALLSQLVPNLVGNIPVLGAVLEPILTPVIDLVLAILDPLLNLVGALVLEPLLELLGVSVGSAEITMKAMTVERPVIFRVE
ncbi:MAG: pilus assembly protein TadG-related protein [Pseudomonadota bacterium]